MSAGAFRSIRAKLFTGVAIALLVALMVTGGSLFAFDLYMHRQASAADLSTQAELLGNTTSAALQFGDQRVAQQNLDFLSARPAIRAAAIYDAGGNVFARYARDGDAQAQVPGRPGALGARVDGDHVLIFRTITAGGEALGTVFLDADLQIGRRVRSYAGIAVVVIAAALALALLISARLQADITRPIIEVADLARGVVERRDYSLRASARSNDEVGMLVAGFNEMLAEIGRRTAATEASNAEIGRLNVDLERRVLERTAQLEDTNRQLQAANAAKSSFLSMMSHEIRTPMNGALGMLELLALTDLDPQQRASLEVVRGSGRALLRIIDDILDFSKIEAGKLEIVPEVASIGTLVRGVAAIYAGNASSKSLTLGARVDERISPAVLVDPLRLQQVLNNLASNAIKFTPAGRIEIVAEQVSRGEREESIRFAVSDTGIGIAPEAQARLFQPFAQASGDTARNFGGTGLGLSICQRLVNLMGGSISVESHPGRGTTMSFTLTLPIADPASLPEADAVSESDALAATLAARRRAPSIEQAEAEGSLVMVVDDHPINRLVLMRQVTALGYAAISAEHGLEALGLWREHRVGLVLTDCNMPEMDGYELARAIRGFERDGGRPRSTIIACTANALRGDAEKCFAAGMDDYVSKPVEMTRLLLKLGQWLPVPAGNEAPLPALPPDRAARGDLAAPVDSRALALVTGGDEELAREAFARFFEANGDDVAALAQGVEARDATAVTRAAHRIKGASRTLGAMPLGEVSEAIERCARAADLAGVEEQMPRLRAELARLDAWRRGRGGGG